MSAFEPIVTDYVTLTEREFVESSLRPYRKLFLYMHIFTIIGLIAFGLMISTGNQALGLPSIIFLCLGLSYRPGVKAWLTSTFRNPKNKITADPSRAIIDHEKICFENKSGATSCVPWGNFGFIEKVREDYLLYLSTYSMIIMLRRAQTDESWERFEELMREKIGKQDAVSAASQ